MAEKDTAKTRLTTLESEVTALQTAFDAMPPGTADEQAAKGNAQGALNAKKGERDTAQTAFDTKEGVFNTAKTAWDAAETTRIAQEAQEYENDLNADWTAVKKDYEFAKKTIDQFQKELADWKKFQTDNADNKDDFLKGRN